MIKVPYDLKMVIEAVNEGMALIRFNSTLYNTINDDRIDENILRLLNSSDEDEEAEIDDLDYHEAEILFWNNKTEEYDVYVGNLEEANNEEIK